MINVCLSFERNIGHASEQQKATHAVNLERHLSSDDTLLHGLLADVKEVLPADGPRLPSRHTWVTVRVGVQLRHLLLACDRGAAHL